MQSILLAVLLLDNPIMHQAITVQGLGGKKKNIVGNLM
jgi:hypothetical protein